MDRRVADPEKVSRDMRYARGDNGERRFNVEEFLTAQQIQSYFSRNCCKIEARSYRPVRARLHRR